MADSYPQTQGPPVTWTEFPGSQEPSFGGVLDVDTSNQVIIRGQNATQRVGTDIVDITGIVINDTGAPVTLSKVQFSLTGLSGPWTDAIILSGDPAYNFPTVGSPSGEAFTVPVQITDYLTDYLYYNLEMTY